MRRILVACTMLLATAQVSATTINCADTTLNHMQMDSAYAASCLAAGTGNISGNPATDEFLLTAAGAGFTLQSKDDADVVNDAFDPFSITFTQSPLADKSSTGTWSIDADFWNHYDSAALGFKFGTGNQPDEWFVFELAQGVSSGTWDFVNMFAKGGGLSHVNLYSADPKVLLPEPSSLMLMFAGLLITLGLRRRS